MIRTLLAPGSLALMLLTLPGQPLTGDPPAPPRPVYKGPLGLVVDPAGRRAYVALHSAGAVAAVDLQAGKVLWEVAVGRRPFDVCLAGERLLVTCEDDDALAVLDVGRPAVVQKIPVGQAPRGVAGSADGRHAYVLCHDEQSLRGIELATGKTEHLLLPGWPQRLGWHRQGKKTCLLALSTRSGQAAISLVGPTPRLHVERTVWLKDVTNARALASKPGQPPAVLAVYQNPRTNIPTTQVAQGWIFTNMLGIVPLADTGSPARPAVRGRLLDDPYQSSADPADVALSADGTHAFVACAGADAVLVVRTDQAAATGYGPEDLARTRLHVRARLGTQANPRRLVLSGDGSTVVVSNYLADSLTVIDARTRRVLRHIPLGGPPPDAARRGEVLFHSARMTFQGQFTCASCHPGGAADGLNWDLTRDGIGNFMNTRSLHGVRDTAPYGWYSTSPTLADRVIGTLRNLHRHEPEPDQVEALVAYLRTLPPPRPLPLPAEERPAAARGRLLFEGKAGCVRCHAGATLQDGKAHNLGTARPQDTQGAFDTPSLRGVARTAPYLHDGRAATLEEIFTRHNGAQRHGNAHRLSAEELRDLVAYLKSL